MAYGSTLTCEQDPQCSRKKRGAFFTPPGLADYIVGATIASPHDVVFEPSCGEAEFLRAAFERMRRLGTDAADPSANLFGCEIHEDSAGAALERMRSLGADPTITVGDFFELAGARRFDAVVGNPPYVRYQDFSGAQRETALDACRAAGIELSALSSSWAPFVVLCTRSLEIGGSLGLVLPAELLTVNYAGPVRKMLLDDFGEIELTLFNQRVFPEVQEEVVALAARNYRQASTHELVVRHAHDLSDISSCPTTVVPMVPDGSRWSRALVQTDLAAAGTGADFCDLGAWGVVFLGAVTGNNAFFALSKARADEWGLGDRDCRPLVPPGSKHVRRLCYDASLHSSLEDRSLQTRLFLPAGDHLSDAARDYIAYGERSGASEGYKCRKRSPWWRVPLPQQPSDLFFTYMNASSPQLCSNDVGATHLNSIHGVRLNSNVRELGKAFLPVASVNTFSALSAELNGRPYGGGVLKMEPREAARFSVPSPAAVTSCTRDLEAVRPSVESLLAEGDFAAAARAVDTVLQNACDIPTPRLNEARDALNALQKRRHDRARA